MDLLLKIITNPGILLFLLVGAVLGLSYVTNYCLARVFRGRTYRLLLGPGVIVHEYAHALGCVLTGARIRRISAFSAGGGFVEHEAPRVPGGQAVISFAPIAVGALAVYLLAAWLQPGLIGLIGLEFATWRFIAFLYLAGTITAAMAPSVPDLKLGLAGFAAACLVLGVAALDTRLAGYFSFIIGDSYEAVLKVVLFALIIQVALTVSAAIAYLVQHYFSDRQGTRHSSFE